MPQIAASLSDVANVAAERRGRHWKSTKKREAPEGEEAETLRVRQGQEGGVGRTSFNDRYSVLWFASHNLFSFLVLPRERGLTGDSNSGQKGDFASTDCGILLNETLASQVKYLEKQLCDALSQLRDVVIKSPTVIK